MRLLPTHRCFDDALEFFALGREPHEPLSSFMVVHGICLTPEGDPYAHAWVEHGDTVLQGGIWNRLRCWYGVDLADFRASYRVQEETRYTPEEALRENHRTGHYGPWVERYRALCSRDKRMWEARHG